MFGAMVKANYFFRHGNAAQLLTGLLPLLFIALIFAPAYIKPTAAGQINNLKDTHLIMFDTPGCPYCQLWEEQIGPAYPHSAEGKRAPLTRIDVSRANDLGIDFAAPVIFAPTFVLIHKGQEVGRLTGYQGDEFFWPLLDQIFQKLPAS